MKNIYLAARYSKHAEMQGVRDVLEALGYKITSRWIDLHEGKYPTSFTSEILNSDPTYCASIAYKDIEDIFEADTIISFTWPDGGGKGGRHVEFGLGIGLDKNLILIGPREHVFHTLAKVKHFNTWPEFVMSIS